MPDKPTADGAVVIGTEREEPVAEPKPTVAESGEQHSETPAAPEPVDLSKFEEFRKYDANMQRKVAELSRSAQEAQRRAMEAEQIASKERLIANTRSRLQSQGVDDGTINETVGELEGEVQQLRAYRMMRDILDEYGFKPAELDQADYGRGPDDLRANLGRKKAQRELEEARKAVEEAKKEAERLKAEASQLAKSQELQDRRTTGADRLAGGEPMPRPADQEVLYNEYQKAVNKALTGLHKVQIRQQFRDRGLRI
ncbi:MAG: hypothetical protein WC683_08715 [bacterium]